MGNTASTTQGISSQSPKLVVKPPADWNSQTEAQKFVVVSPQSDISNPSQIRHPNHRSKQSTMTNKTPMSKRTSKVVSKQVPRTMMNHKMSTDLPAPESFYFDPSSSSDQVIDSQSVGVTGGKRSLHQTMKAKATRARQILKGCWKEQKHALEGCVRDNEDNVEHQRLQSMSPSYANRRSTQSKQKMSNIGQQQCIQFIPEAEEEPDQGTISPRHVYLHDEDVYMNRIHGQDHSETPMMSKTNIKNNDLCPSDGNLAHNSPVAKLFDRGTYSEVMVQENKIQPVSADKKTREQSALEKEIQRQVDEQVRLQFESKREEIGRVKRLRESYLQKLEATKRLSQEEDFKRKSVESKMEMMREKVVLEEFQQQSVAVSSGDNPVPFDEPEQPLKKSTIHHSSKQPFDGAVQEEKKENTRSGRSSAPVPPSTNIMESALLPKRKSAPAGTSAKPLVPKTTKNIPVLLKIAGWEQAISTSQPQPQKKPTEPELPAVLKLAGWKQAGNPTNHGNNPVTSSSLPVDAPVKEAVQKAHNIEPTASADTQYDADEEEESVSKQTPLPSSIQLHRSVPRETPVVKKMTRMLLATQSFASEFDKSHQSNQYGSSVHSTNLDDSVASDATPFGEGSGQPMVAHDALVNAAFLFSPSYVDNNPSLLRLGERKSEASTTITTLDSRHRLVPSYSSRGSTVSAASKLVSERTSSASTKPTIGAYSNPSIFKLAQKSTKQFGSLASKSRDTTDRHVRFSVDEDIVVTSSQKESKYAKKIVENKSPLRSDSLVVPAIEHKLSDLTDAFGGGRESLLSLQVEDTEPSPHATSNMTTDLEKNEESPIHSDTQENIQEPSPPSNWSYSVDMDNGVTPLRSGRGGSKSNKTNSPHKRFNEAKSRFALSGKVSPVKKKSPVKARPKRSRQTGGIVHARVIAMEQRNKEIVEPLPKTRRDTNAYKAIAPRRAVLKSPHFKNVQSEKPISVDDGNGVQSGRDSTSTLASKNRLGFQKPPVTAMKQYRESGLNSARTTTASKQSLSQRNEASSAPSTDDSDSESDAFGYIRKTSSVDDHEIRTANKVVKQLVDAHNRSGNITNTSASTDIEDDDFAAILQFQGSADADDDDDDSVGRDTVSTLQRRRLSNGSSTVMSGLTGPTLVRRSSIMSGATASTVVRRSSTLSGSTTRTLQTREDKAVAKVSYVSRPSWSSYPPRSTLPFRENALVRPTEQSHRIHPGQPVLSPMQRTPMQALKWRTLAAQEKGKGGSLGNGANTRRQPLRKSDPNVVGF